MNADTAWNEYNYQPEHNWSDGGAVHQAFLAGYRRALQDAADDLPVLTRRAYIQWLRDRAAAVGVTGDTGGNDE